MSRSRLSALVTLFFFFFNDTATTEIYTLSLHDALPISFPPRIGADGRAHRSAARRHLDRKSTRLNSSHTDISYAVFCLKKKNIVFWLKTYYNIVFYIGLQCVV